MMARLWLKPFPSKMAELINNHYRILTFSSPNITPMQIFQPISKKKETLSKQNDFELDYIFSSFKTAISYRRDLNLTKFSNAYS